MSPAASKLHPLTSEAATEGALKYTILIFETSKTKEKRPPQQAPKEPTGRRMTQRHLGETKAGECLPASPGGGGEGRKRFAVPKAKPTPALRLGPASELGVAPGRSGGPTCDTRPPPSPPPSGGRAAPRGSQPEGPPLPAERGQAGPRPRRRERSAEQTEPSGPPHPYTQLGPALRQQPRPSGGEAPHSHSAAPRSAARTRPAPGPARLPVRPPLRAADARLPASRPAPALPLTSESPPGVGGSLRGLLRFRRRGTLPVTSSRRAGRGVVLVTSSRRNGRAGRGAALPARPVWGRWGGLEKGAFIAQRYRCATSSSVPCPRIP